LAHFKTDGILNYIEILDIQKADSKDYSTEELTSPIFEDIDLKRLAKEQEWQGFDERKFKQAINGMKVEESPEELLELLKE
jgi:DNA topoisomerase VI subunit A